MGLLKFPKFKSKVDKQKENMEAKYEDKNFVKDESFGLTQGKDISLPKGNPPINK